MEPRWGGAASADQAVMGRSWRAAPWLFVLVAASVLAFSLSVALRPSGEVYLWADLGAYNAAFLVAGLLLILRTVAGGASQWAWSLIGLGLVLDAVGGVLWSISEVAGLPETTPALPDLLWLLSYPLFFVALGGLSRDRLREQGAHGYLDATLVGSGTFALALVLFADPLAGLALGGWSPEDLANAAYLLGDAVLIALVAMVGQVSSWRLSPSWWLLLAGFTAFAAGDAAYLMQVARDTYVEGSGVDLLWPLAVLLLGAAALSLRPLPPRRRIHGGRMDLAAALVPGLAILLSASILLGGAMASARYVSWLAASFAALSIVLGIARMIIALSDASRLAQQLREARLDPLTGLPNRRSVERMPPLSAAIVLDIDDMTSVNRSLGAERGDLLLVSVAARLRESVRASDEVIRSGGDEFAVLLPTRTTEEALSIAEGLVRTLQDPLTIDGRTIDITASAGVSALADSGSGSASDLIAEANEALRIGKREGPGLVRSFSGSIGEQSHDRLRRRGAVRAALREGGDTFFPYFQPILSLTDGSVLVCEALARWRHEGRVLNPAEFIDDVEQAGLMPALTSRMIRSSLDETARAGLSIPVAVNIPPELLTEVLVDEVDSAMAETGTAPELLAIEVTETAILRDPAAASAILRRLRDRGVRVLLDDFGTGWSGLSSLRDLGIDGLKLDYSFVSRMATDPTSAAIVRGIASVAAELGVLVIYEGVEDPQVHDLVLGLDAGYVQGFSIARPMPIDDLVAWIAARPAALGGRQPSQQESISEPVSPRFPRGQPTPPADP